MKGLDDQNMKKIVSLILTILFFLSLNRIFAQDDPNFTVLVDPNVCGEISNIELSFDSLPFVLDSESAMVINFPIGFTLPSYISLDSVIIDDEKTPVFLNVTSNSVFLKMEASAKNSLIITFLKSASIKNPLSPDEDYRVLVVFNDKKLFLESSSIVFKSPENSILLERGINIMTASGWIPKEFDLKLSSNLAKEIYYSLDDNPYSLYEATMRITNGIHKIKYFGVRNSDANESVASTGYYVDSMKPSIKLISPPAGSLINELRKELIFSIDDFSPVTVFLGSNKALVDSSGYAKLKIALKPGDNNFEAVAVDSANYETHLSFSIFVDITPPTLLIFSPKKGERICRDIVEIIGKAEIGTEVFVENYKVKPDTYGNFTFKLLPKTGQNKVRVKACDKAGNETIVNLEFYFVKANVIEFFIGKSIAIVNGFEKEISPPPFIDSNSGEVYVSLRFTAINLGFKLTWNDKESSAILSFLGREALIKPNDNIVRVKYPSYEREVLLKNPPTIFGGSIVIPIEFLNKVLLGEVIYDINEKKIVSKFCLEKESD